MKPKQVIENKVFVGRESEQFQLRSMDKESGAKLLVVYGRRRVGKTELLEQVFRQRNILKFEGIEGKPEVEQGRHVLEELAIYCEEPYLAKLPFTSWKDFFIFIAQKIANKKITLYFEEVQWLANNNPSFVTELKYVWDNYFRHHDSLILILCGSSPSFMINHVLRSKALYNRSQWELPVQPFTLKETREFLPKYDLRSVMDAYLTLGGIPEYLKRVKKGPSIFLQLCQESFVPGGFFLHEYQRIFTSSLANNKHYQKIIDFLSQQKFATREDILRHLGIHSSGTLTEVLMDLEVCGFIQRYTPFQTKKSSTLSRYQVADHYLQFYFAFIQPISSRIERGDYRDQPSHALKMDRYYQWLGFSFERFCQRNAALIAKRLGFGAVHYRSGVFFNRETDKQQRGFQIDLIFEREDRVYTVCEIKYTQAKTSTSVIDEMEKKLALFEPKKHYTLHRVLITAAGAEEALLNRAYFDDVLGLEDFKC